MGTLRLRFFEYKGRTHMVDPEEIHSWLAAMKTHEDHLAKCNEEMTAINNWDAEGQPAEIISIVNRYQSELLRKIDMHKEEVIHYKRLATERQAEHAEIIKNGKELVS